MQLARWSSTRVLSSAEAFRVLAVRDYRWYWIASFAYYAAINMDMVARGWLAYELSGSAFLLGIVTASQGVPQSIIGLIGGLVADRVSKRGVLLWAQLVLTAGASVTAILITAGAIELYQVAILAMVQGGAMGMALPGRLAFVSDIVPRDRFLRAYGLFYVALNSMRIVAPAAAGLLIGVIGTGGIFYLIAIFHFLSLMGLLFVSKSGAPAVAKKSSMVHDFVEVIAYARRNGIIPILMGLEIVINFFGQSLASLMPVFAVSVFNVGSNGMGTLMGALGIGALIGSLAVASVGNFKRKPVMLLVTGVVNGVAVILFAATPFFIPALAFIAVAGIASAAYMTLNSALFQLNAVDAMRSRVMSLYMLGFAVAPIALLPIGGAIDLVGASLATGVGGGILVAAMLLGALLFPKFRKLEI